MCDVVEYVCHVAQVRGGEDRVQHLALSPMTAAFRREKSRSEKQVEIAEVNEGQRTVNVAVERSAYIL